MITCVVITVVLLFYTYFGYPICIGALARLRPRGDRDGDPRPASPARVTVCLPVWNGEATLKAKLDSLLAQNHPADAVEILVYCDGCSDGSERIAHTVAASSAAAGRIRVVVSAERRGKPTALNTLAAAATGDLLLLNDVRQPLSPTALGALAAALEDPEVGCATGQLVLEGGAASGVYWRYENWIRVRESRFRGVVGMTGSIAMMRRADFRPLPEDIILDDVWIPMQLGLHGKRVVLVDAAQAYDTALEDDREFQRKVRTLAGNYQLFGRMPALLNPAANRIWFETISHKVLRLIAPWLMLALAAASLAGSAVGAPGMRALVVAQAAFYLAATAGRRGGRLAGVARTFVVMNVAAVAGLVRHLAGRQRITW